MPAPDAPVVRSTPQSTMRSAIIRRHFVRLRGTLVGGLTASDVDALVANRVGESRVLDFKETLPGTNNEQRKDFLADVTALANTTGGVIVYGIRTERDTAGHDTGIAEAVVGLGQINVDQEVLRLQSMAHDGASPSLASLI